MLKIACLRNNFLAFIVLLLPPLSQAQVIQTNVKVTSVDYKKLAKIDGVINE